MVGDEITGSEVDTKPANPVHAKDAAVQSQDREFDDTKAPCIDENIGERNLAVVSAAMPAFLEE
jgi:hypothetical protein